jgi:hypothetical protein
MKSPGIPPKLHGEKLVLNSLCYGLALCPKMFEIFAYRITDEKNLCNCIFGFILLTIYI